MALGWLCVAAIIYLSLTPVRLELVPAKHGDKLEHAFAYGFLMLWFCQDYQRRTQRMMLALLLIALSVGMEILQGLMGHRSFNYSDMLANNIGVLLGWTAACTALGRIGAMLEARIAR
jgi:VanZ family protein